jgi:hypothetical protein
VLLFAEGEAEALAFTVVALAITSPTAMALLLVLVVLVGLVGLLAGQLEGLEEGFAEILSVKDLVGMMIVTQNVHDIRWVLSFQSRFKLKGILYNLWLCL